MARQRRNHHFWRNLLILIVLFGIYLYWGNRSIETDEATFTSGALPAGFDGCRIVQLSDLHGKYFGKGNERLYSAVKAAHPEYIFVTGDLVDRKTENPTIYAGEVGAALSAIAPTYYVTGNHEWGHGTKVVEEIKRTLRESGVTVLFGVLTTDTIEQAIERAGTKAGNKGYDCALSAVEMVNLLREIGD